MDTKELDDRGFSIQDFGQIANYDPASKLIIDAAREGVAPFHPRIINLEVWKSLDNGRFGDGWRGLFEYYAFSITFPAWPRLRHKFRIQVEDAHEMMDDGSLALYLAEVVYGHYRYGSRIVEPGPHIILGEE